MTEYRYHTCDVFTREAFGGNPLAVVPDARGLDTEAMQALAREFNYSETTFVLPAGQGCTRKVRIFTPRIEVPFAGHPNIGTAFMLASLGEVSLAEGAGTVTFEEQAGVVPIRIEQDAEGQTFCELTAPEPLSLGPEVAVEVPAAAQEDGRTFPRWLLAAIVGGASPLTSLGGEME
jgi:trans-2,3-dihydro-3-hydroxyanthranilate isomerase